MNLQQINFNQILAFVSDIATRIVGLGLLFLILAFVLAKYGFKLPYVPAQSASDLAWICGAWWLYRGGKL